MGHRQDLRLDSGRDYVLRATLYDGETGLVMDLSTILEAQWALVRAEIQDYSSWLARRDTRCGVSRRCATPPAASVEKSLTEGGITVTDPTGGKVAIALDAADTEALCGYYEHELTVTNSAGKKTTVLFGDVEMNRNLVAA